MRGRFITLEGVDGAGKTTQAALLADGLRESGLDIIATREPGGSPGAEDIRALLVRGAVARWDPMTEALLHFAARKEHLKHRILPALDAGTWVVCDRFTDSTMAYQGYAHGLGPESVRALSELVVGALVPDLTLVLDLAVDVARARATSAAGEDRYERMGRAFHDRLCDGYRDIALREPDRCALIDAGGALDEVQSAIRAAVGERLGVGFA
ncbi:MAG TPA: dTMP kinase [Rhodospirillales bacterium]|jgi:dTMP kinase|nr:dTMP kinase [Rhodospirillales bacterium]